MAGRECLPQKAPDDVLQESDRLLVDQLSDHVAKDGANSVETLVSLTDVLKTHVVEQDLLNDENGDGFAKLGTSLHNAKTERDDLGGEKEVDDLRGIVLDKSADDTKRGKAEIFEGSRL